MEDRQSRLLTWLAGALLVLVAIIVLVEPPEGGGGDDETEQWTPLFGEGIIEDDVGGLTLVRGDEKLAFERGDDGWTLAGADGAAREADDAVVDSLVRAVLGVEVGDALSEGGDHSGFGLRPPAAVITLTLEDGGSHTLRVGDDTRVGWYTYVSDGATGDDGPVYAAHTRLGEQVTQDAAAFRDRDALRFDQQSVTAVRITDRSADGDVPTAPLTFERVEHSWWRAGELRSRADGDRIAALLSGLGRLQATEFLPASEPDPSGGVEVAITDRDGPRTLILGPVTDGSRVVRSPLHPELLRVRDSVEALALDADAWLEPRLLPLRPGDLTALELRLGDESLSASRAEDGWSQPAAEGVLTALDAVRVDRATPVPAPEGEPWGLVRATGAADEVATVTLHQPLPDGGRVAVSAVPCS